jgi:energy-converting hydrogenase Eha subunit E
MAEAFGYALSALAMAVIFIYMILASQFKSFFQPLALMTALPTDLIGVVLALLMFNSTLSMFSVIGVVMLMGLVTKNAILLVDFAIRARSEHVNDHGPTGGWTGPARCPAAGSPGAPAADPDDHPGDDFWHDAAGLALSEGCRNARTHGPGGDRRRDHLVTADAGGGASGVLLHG